MRGPHSHEILVALAAALFLVLHLALAQPVLEDIDSINFALGVTSYDVGQHQPHPPGYPVFIALSRLTAWALGLVGVSDVVARALVLQAGLAGALGVLAVWRLLLVAGWSKPAAAWTALLWAVAPLVWLTAARPLSDMPGLAAALLAQGLLLRLAAPDAHRRAVAVLAIGCITGLAVGLRSQVVWLTAPVALLAVARLWRSRRRDSLVLVAGGLAGVMAWLVPMLVATGGLDAYLGALDSQADDDFTGVPMLAMSFGLRRLTTALIDTLVYPWGTPVLAGVALALCCVGMIRLARRQPTRLQVLTWLYAPYLAFHLLFQETETTRYALPLMLPLVALMAGSLTGHTAARVRGMAPAALGLLLAVLLGTSLHAHALYRQPSLRAGEVVSSLREAASVRRPDVVLMHRRVFAETRRIRQVSPPLPGAPADVPRDHEWLALAPVFGGSRLQAWWLVDPQRGDRVAIDPRGQQHRAWFGWTRPAAWLLGGMRPHPFDWYVIDEPTWMLQDGWSLTPELAGLTRAAGEGPGGASGARALVRRRGVTQTVLVGGRLVTTTAGEVGTLPMTVTLGAWQAEAAIDAGSFRRVWQVDDPSGDMSAARVEHLAVSAPGGPETSQQLLLEQFDVQDAGVPVVALGDGWQEPERDPQTGRMWRWMSDAARLEVWGAPCDLRLRVRGTWPRHYAHPPVLTVRTPAGGEVYRAALTRPFAVDVPLRADSHQQQPLVVDLSSDIAFVAGERTGTADARRLAIEVADLQVVPSSGGLSCVAGLAARRAR